MKNKKIMFPAAALLVVAAAILILLTARDKKENIIFSEEYVMAEELPALLSFTYYDTAEWEKVIEETAEGKVSYRELEALLEQMGVREYVSFEKKAGFFNVPRTVFFQVYGQLTDILDAEEQVTEQDMVFIKPESIQEQANAQKGQKKDSGEQEASKMRWLTQNGYETIAGGGQYISQYDMYRVYTFHGAVIGIKKRLDTPVMWENVFLHSTEEGKASVLFEKELLTIELPALKEAITDTVCDLEWKDGAVSAIYKKEETIQGTVLSYDQKHIEIAGYGSLSHNGNLRIYKTYGTVEQLDESKLMIGNLVADCVVAQGQVCGIILREPSRIEQIRVLLLNKESPYYPEIYVTADTEATVGFGEKQEKIAASTLIKVSDYWKDNKEGYLRIHMETEQGSLFLSNEKQEPISLGYQGSFEIRRFEEGYVIVNELPLEDYLCAVVPSEMPSSYEIEALRAQAVCARSYACIQLFQDEYARFGANVDDSTNYQVYNKQAREERTTLAVRDTVGEVIRYNGAVAEAYYYSTSCGFSQNVDVWNLNQEEYGYLKSVSLLADGAEMDFSDEAVFEEYIRNREYMACDSEGKYFRWRAELDMAAFLEKINAAVVERQAVNAEHVQVFDQKGTECGMNPEQLGAITGVAEEERSAGGVLKKLRIQYEKGTILLTTEYNIRKILGTAVVNMTDKNDDAITTMTLLPSAAFTVIPVEQGYVLYGGGYGHGIGLSQNGANGMAKEGFTYTDILQKFYQNITIENVYNSPDGL